MKKKTNRLWAALLCLCLLPGLTACGETAVEKTAYQQALDAIQVRDYETAYTLLKGSKDRRAAEELEKFVFVPEEYTFKNSGNTDIVYEYAYDELGNLLKEKTTYAPDEQYLNEYTYSGYKQLSYHFQGVGNVFSYKYTYDSAGNRVQEWHLDRNGDWIGKTTYTYDEQNHCLSKEVLEKENAQDMTPEVTETRYYTYDTEGRMLSSEYTFYYEGALMGRTTVYNTYEADGSYREETREEGSDTGFNQISTTYYAADGKVLKVERRRDDETEPYLTYEYRYNERGDVAYYHEYAAASGREEVTLYEYDDEGRLLKTETTDREGETVYIETNTYDQAGNCLTHEEVDLDVNSWRKVVNTYDQQNHLLRVKDDYNGGWATTTYTYDQQGNKVKEEQESSTGTYTKKFEYDQWGNVIDYFQYRTETIGETAVEKTARWVLRYYPETVPAKVQHAIDIIDMD